MKNPPKYPLAPMKELRQHAEQNKLSIAQVILANESLAPIVASSSQVTLRECETRSGF